MSQFLIRYPHPQVLPARGNALFEMSLAEVEETLFKGKVHCHSSLPLQESRLKSLKPKSPYILKEDVTARF